MPKGTVSKSSSHCKSMEAFQQGLVGRKINSIEVAAGSTVRVCKDASVANKIAMAFSTCHNSTCRSQTFSCNGKPWRVGKCGSGGELMVGGSRICDCGKADVIIRPCIGNGAWGGDGGGCSPNTTTLRITASYGTFHLHKCITK